MFYMIKPEKIKPGDMIIIESIIDLPPILAAAHQSHMAQPTQLMRHSRHAHLKLIRDIAQIYKNYNFTTQNAVGGLTVVKRLASVSATSNSKIYADNEPALTGTYDNFTEILQSDEVRARTVRQLGLNDKDALFQIDTKPLRDSDFTAVTVNGGAAVS